MPKSKPMIHPDSGQLVLKDVSSLMALADPLRLQILIELSYGDRTVKEVAAELEVPVTRLYYHFKILQRAGLIKVAGRRMVSGIEERRYRGTASSWTIDPAATPAAVESGIIGAITALVRAELELALLAKPVPIGDKGSPVPFLALTRLVLSPREVELLQRRIRDVLVRFSDDGPVPAGKQEYHALFAAYLRPGELRSPSAASESGERGSSAP
jgi:DNA-binding transcriptional ArsR family regulator